jgi:hypothetical protein
MSVVRSLFATLGEKIMNDAETALQHFRAIVSLGEKLKEIGVAIYEHQYYSLVFGSWAIIAGSRKVRSKISWDGRDRFLDFSESHFPDSSYSTKE